MDKYNIPMEKLYQHNHWSGKNCPTYLRNGSKGIDWGDFKSMVKAHGPGSSKPPQPPTGDIDVDGYWGNDTTFALQKAMGTPEDGFISQQPSQHKSKNPGLKNGWEWTSDPAERWLDRHPRGAGATQGRGLLLRQD